MGKDFKTKKGFTHALNKLSAETLLDLEPLIPLMHIDGTGFKRFQGSYYGHDIYFYIGVDIMGVIYFYGENENVSIKFNPNFS